jgi:hypothetical protein
MLKSISQTAITEFKRTGYRIAKYRREPVSTVTDLVQLAYLDVNRTLRNIDQAQSGCFKSPVAAFICDLSARPPTSQGEFDVRHKACCEQSIGCAGPAEIRYGQAQKVVNMSLKYLYNEYAHYGRTPSAFAYPKASIECFFHLPIDNQLLSYLVDRCGFNAIRAPWSKWNYDDYISFQRALRSRLRNGCVPLELDYLIWNKQDASIGEVLAPG